MIKWDCGNNPPCLIVFTLLSNKIIHPGNNARSSRASSISPLCKMALVPVQHTLPPCAPYQTAGTFSHNCRQLLIELSAV